MEEKNQSGRIYRFKWFMSMSRKPSPKADELKNHYSASSEKLTNISGVFFTLRKRFQKKMSSIKINAYGPELNSETSNHTVENKRLAAYVSNFRYDDDFARIVIERHSQNPIRFSSPNFPAIHSRDALLVTSHNELTNQVNAESSTPSSTHINKMMKKVREDLLKYGWYWGKLSRSAAQKRLARQENGTFLVRDSETEKDQFAVSFRSSGITLHCRIDHIDNFR